MYNKYCEWQYMQDDNCILTPKPNFKNILKNYHEISFHSGDSKYAIPTYFSGLKLNKYDIY